MAIMTSHNMFPVLQKLFGLPEGRYISMTIRLQLDSLVMIETEQLGGYDPEAEEFEKIGRRYQVLEIQDEPAQADQEGE